MKHPALFTAFAACLIFVSAIALSVLAVPASAATDSVTDKSNAELLAARDKPATVKCGKKIYRDLCQSCHGDAVTNLFDMKWYHGGRPAEIEHSTLTGLLDKGMPAWKDALQTEDITAVTAYLLTFQKR